MKDGGRVARVAEQIRRELATIVLLELKDPRVGMVSVTAVQLSPDYSHAKVLVSSLADAAAMDASLQGLRSAAGFLRAKLGERIRIHTLPALHFVADDSIARGMSLSRLIDQAVAQAAPQEDSDSTAE